MKLIFAAATLLTATAIAFAILAIPVYRVPLRTRERFPAAIISVLLGGAIVYAGLSNW